MKKALSVLAGIVILASCGNEISQQNYGNFKLPAYDFAFGLNWNGVIDDWRVEKYR